ncbi:hypothetical protein DICVIV_14210 [Dictyocaulus viviparus]|uniref:Uncharacterized protein n=1 Tax=Dictyocaulus viviparus TaxID=29172 RepID=A0A0D8X8C0_DICVI|nr:hypothetical protein DICVIV_14210 [Dictyocaulus viviparus]
MPQPQPPSGGGNSTGRRRRRETKLTNAEQNVISHILQTATNGFATSMIYINATEAAVAFV